MRVQLEVEIASIVLMSKAQQPAAQEQSAQFTAPGAVTGAEDAGAAPAAQEGITGAPTSPFALEAAAAALSAQDAGPGPGALEAESGAPMGPMALAPQIAAASGAFGMSATADGQDAGAAPGTEDGATGAPTSPMAMAPSSTGEFGEFGAEDAGGAPAIDFGTESTGENGGAS